MLSPEMCSYLTKCAELQATWDYVEWLKKRIRWCIDDKHKHGGLSETPQDDEIACCQVELEKTMPRLRQMDEAVMYNRFNVPEKMTHEEHMRRHEYMSGIRDAYFNKLVYGRG
jgi:hypothetical protein